MHNEASGHFNVRGGPLRALGLRYEELFDYLDVLQDLGTISLHRFMSEVAVIGLLSPGVSVALSGSLDALQRRGGRMGSGISIGAINAPGGVVGVGRDSFTQSVAMNSGSGELRQILSELTEAIRELDDSVTEKAVAETVAEQVLAALDATDRDIAKTDRLWAYLGRFADGVQTLGVIGAPTTVKALYDQAEPLIRPLLQLGGGG